MDPIYKPADCYTHVQVMRILWPGEVPRNTIRVRLLRARNEKGLPYVAMGTRTFLYPRDEVAKWLQARHRNMSHA